MKELKLPPHNLDAERSVLGCQLLDGQKIDVVREIIQPSDFYVPANAIIQTAIHRLRDGGSEADPITLGDQLESMDKLDEVGGPVYVLEVLQSVPHGAHAAHYANLVAGCSRRRKAMAIGRELAERAADISADEESLIESTLTAVTKLNSILVQKAKGPSLLSDHVNGVIQTYEKGLTPSVHWGIPAIDQLIGGCMMGELVIIGARPSHGKSLVGLQWLDEASRHGIPSLMISEEMSAESLATRSLNSITVIPSHEWHQSIDRIKFDAREHFESRAPILIEEKCHKVSSAERAIARAVQSHGIKIVAVDYAQLLIGEGDTKAQRIADVSSRLKCCAMRYEIIVLLLAQLNRGIESRELASPKLSDLSESGGLENDADVALFPFWPWKFDDTYEDREEYRVYVRKNRNRGIGESVVRMRINAARQRIEPYTEPDEWEQDSWK